jgi:hypothetical protein
MNTPARIRTEPVPELLALVRALARQAAREDYARVSRQPERSE